MSDSASGGAGGRDAKHADEVERLSRQLTALRPGAAPLTLAQPETGELPEAGNRVHRKRLGAVGTSGPRRGAANSTAPPLRAGAGRRHAEGTGSELATVLPFRRPGSADDAADQASDTSRPTRSGAAGRRQSQADRQERKAAARVAAAEVFAAQLEADPEETARELCLGWLAVRPHTRAELAAKLRRKGVPPEAMGDVLDRFGEVGLIDDAAFAEAWVASRHLGRGLAKRALAYELRARGVDGATVDAAVSRLDPAEEEARARTLVTRKLATMGHVPAEARARRLMGMLARKGYPGGLAAAVVREVMAGSGVDLEDGDPG